ncbi:MAG: amino acid permease [Bacteroidia bacterium]
MSHRELKRTLGLADATSLVAGSMIGSGIFIVSSSMALDLGSAGWLLLAWLLTGAITMTAALSYGELAGMMPHAGGQYVYIRRAWGKLVAFLYGWSVFAVIQTGVIAAVAMAFANYTSELLPVFSMKNILLQIGAFKISAGQLLAVASIIFLTWLNSRGVRGGALVQRFFTSAKLLALFALIVLGIIVGVQTDVFSSNMDGLWDATRTFKSGTDEVWTTESLSGFALMSVFGMTMINSLFSSDAWNNVTYIAGEIRDPQKNIPRSLILGTTIVTVLYILANVAYIALLPLKGNPEGNDVISRGMQFAESGRVGTAAATMIFGNVATIFMAVLIMISTFGCNNGLILSGARLYFAMSQDGLFFRKASALNKNSVPEFGLWIQCVWAGLLCFSGTYNDLLTYSTFASLLFYIVTIAGLFRLRSIEPETPRPYKALGYPLLPALYILAAAAICLDLLFMDAGNSVGGLIIVAVGFPLFILQRKTNALP